jgi:site-specific DNA recombinase
MKYLIYCRKSTDTEDRQVLSLDSQERELLDIAEKQNLQVVKILRESMSAKSSGRPVFEQVLNIINAGKADSILCWKLDRLARNFFDGGRIIDSLQRGVIKEIRTYESTHLPTDNVLLLAVQLGMANQYIRDLSTNVKRGNREKLSRGEWPNHAPFGYLNDRATKTIVVDKERSKYVVRAYDLYINDHKNFREISDILYAEGLRTKSGKKILKSHIHRIISNPFYSGIMFRDGKYYDGNHRPLISKNTFDQAQIILNNKAHPKSKRLFFPLRGILKCEICGCSLTATLKKGHHYYYCTNGKRICDEHKSYLRENYLYGIIAKLLEQIEFTERKIELLYQAAKEETERDNTYATEIIKILRAKLESLKTKESKLLDTFLAEQVAKELYDEKSLEMQRERVSLEKELRTLEIKQPAFTMEPIKSAFLEASRASKEFLAGDDFKKEKIVKSFLSNLSIKSKFVAQVSFIKPYGAMARAPKNASIQELLTV